MKKILLVAAVAGLAMVSCKKEYTCECTSTTNASGTTMSVTASTTIKDTKKNATEACEAGTKDNSVGGVTAKVECKIK